MKYSILNFSVLDSTNKYLKENWNSLNDFTFVRAEEQTNGHGRYNRIWESRKGENLLFSLLIKNKYLLDLWKYIPALIPCSVSNVLTHNGFKNVRIKWPNDIYINEKKVCGILLESQLPNYLIVGVGLNINQTSFSIDTATSLANESNKCFDIKALFEEIINQILLDLNNLKNNENFFIKEYQNKNYLLHKKVTFETLEKELTGVVVGIDNENHLLVKVGSAVLSLDSGEVTIKK